MASKQVLAVDLRDSGLQLFCQLHCSSTFPTTVVTISRCLRPHNHACCAGTVCINGSSCLQGTLQLCHMLLLLLQVLLVEGPAAVEGGQHNCQSIGGGGSVPGKLVT
jgi:hypothetical protein